MSVQILTTLLGLGKLFIDHPWFFCVIESLKLVILVPMLTIVLTQSLPVPHETEAM